MKGPLFYSKILLFGEYGIIEDSKGLSIPYNFFNGALKIPDSVSEKSSQSNLILADFCLYLKGLKEIDLDNLFHFVIDDILDSYLPMLESMSIFLDDLEERALLKPKPSILNKAYQIRFNLGSSTRKDILPLKIPGYGFVRTPLRTGDRTHIL